MSALLTVEGLSCGYGEVPVLRDVSLRVEPGEIVALLGANGAGKSTLLRSLAGLLPPSAGRTTFEGRRIERAKPHVILRHGLSLVPEGRGVLAELSVGENLRLGAHIRGGLRDPAALDRVFALFPVLRERWSQTAGLLSGGEQQMLAIGRSFLAEPKLVMIDEMSLGLAPKITGELFQVMLRLRDGGLSLLLVEQDMREILPIADRVYVLTHGAIAFAGSARDLASRAESAMDLYLGL